jgi:hypothetical protein
MLPRTRGLDVPAVEVPYQLDELKMQDCCRGYTWPESVRCNLFGLKHAIPRHYILCYHLPSPPTMSTEGLRESPSVAIVNIGNRPFRSGGYESDNDSGRWRSFEVEVDVAGDCSLAVGSAKVAVGSRVSDRSRSDDRTRDC